MDAIMAAMHPPHLDVALGYLSYAPGISSASIAERYGQIYIGLEYEGRVSSWNIGPHDGAMMDVDSFGAAIALWLRSLRDTLA